jgi:hypothetical protein
LHVNPLLPERGLAMFYNPLLEPISRRIGLPLYYTGLKDRATVLAENGSPRQIALGRDYTAEITVNIPAGSRTWVIIQAPR